MIGRESERLEFADAKDRLKHSWAADREDFARVKEQLKKKNAEHHLQNGRLSQALKVRYHPPSILGASVVLPPSWHNHMRRPGLNAAPCEGWFKYYCLHGYQWQQHTCARKHASMNASMDRALGSTMHMLGLRVHIVVICLCRRRLRHPWSSQAACTTCNAPLEPAVVWLFALC